MLYQLPTKTDKRYRGAYPNRINGASYGGSTSFDADGKKCVSVETNDGSRFTLSYDVLNAAGLTGGFVSLDLSDVVQAGTVLHQLTQERYDEWLSRINAARLLKLRQPLRRMASPLA